MHSHKGFAKLDEDGVGGTAAAAAAGSVTVSSAADGVGGVQGAGSQGSLVGSSNGGGSAPRVIGGALSKLSHRGGRAPVPQSEDGEAGAAKPHHPRNALETSAEATVSGSVFNAVNNIIGESPAARAVWHWHSNRLGCAAQVLGCCPCHGQCVKTACCWAFCALCLWQL